MQETNTIKFYEGGTNSNSESKFIDEIRTKANNNENILVIVPDQFSFEYEKKLYKELNPVIANRIQSAGFNRLCELMCAQYGASGKENASENAKIIMMYKAVNDLKKDGDIKYYKKSIDKSSFISQVINLVEKFRENGVTPETVQLGAQQVTGSVSLKLYDISKLYKYYLEELKNHNLEDSISKMAQCVELADKNGFFEGKCVFISSFNSFSFDEYKMIDVCIKQAKSLSVSLILDNECVKKYNNHPFSETVKTEEKIKQSAMAHNRDFEFIYSDSELFTNEETKYVSKNLFNIGKTKFQNKNENVKIISACNLYEETEYICSEICRLTRENNYKYKDIAVTVRNLNDCSSVFEEIFERYDIPYFIDAKDKVSASSIVHYINSILDCLTSKKYKTDKILKYIKSPLCSMLNYEINDLEEYCISWNVDGDMWTKPFTAMGEHQNEKYLEKINSYREKIINPFEEFKKNSKDTDAKHLCKALYKLFKDINLSERTFSLVKRASLSDNETQLEFSRNLKQLWNSVLSAIKSIYECLGDEKITLRKFTELLRIMLAQMNTSNPPQKLDCVRICDAGHSKLDNVKVNFSAEVIDGVFPARINDSGLITDKEKELLNSKEIITFQDTARKSFQSEKLIAYSTFSIATDKLYVLYSEYELTGTQKQPSFLVNEIKEMFDEEEMTVKVSSLPVEFFCTSPKTTYYKYLEHANDHSSLSETLKEILMNTAYASHIMHIESIKSKKEISLSRENAEKLLLRDEINKVSPTRLETYFSCPFKYFCKYGLDLSVPNAMEFDSLNKGKTIHTLLEKIMSKKDGTKGYDEEFAKMTDKEIRDFISEEFDDYYNNELCGDFGKSETFKFLYNELKENAFCMVSVVRDELNQSKFTPVAMEYDLTKSGNEDILTINVDQNKKIILSGTIDRVDIYTDKNGKQYVRIIDYKTGNINLDYSELYLGLHLQMFVYLSAVLSGKTEFADKDSLSQAGVVYIKLNTKDITNQSELKIPFDKPEEIKNFAQNKEKQSYKEIGTIVDNEEMLKAFGKIYEKKPDMPKGVPENLKSIPKHETSVSENKFSALRKFACGKVKEYGENLLQGKIHPKPVDNACEFCDYKTICPNPYPDEVIDPKDIKYSSQLLEKLEEISKEDNSNEG